MTHLRCHGKQLYWGAPKGFLKHGMILSNRHLHCMIMLKLKMVLDSCIKELFESLLSSRDCSEQLIPINPWNPNKISIEVQESACMLTLLRVPLPENTQQSWRAWCKQGRVASESSFLSHFIICPLKF